MPTLPVHSYTANSYPRILLLDDVRSHLTLPPSLPRREQGDFQQRISHGIQSKNLMLQSRSNDFDVTFLNNVENDYDYNYVTVNVKLS